MNNTKQLKHLLSRAGFGMRFEDLAAFDNVSVKHAVKSLFEATDNGKPLNVVQGETDYGPMVKGDALAKKMFIQQERQEEKDLNVTWMNNMSTTSAPLLE